MATEANDLIITSGDADEEVALLDILDHVVNTGVILRGNIVISLAGVDLIYLGLDVILTSVETALRHLKREALPQQPKL